MNIESLNYLITFYKLFFPYHSLITAAFHSKFKVKITANSSANPENPDRFIHRRVKALSLHKRLENRFNIQIHQCTSISYRHTIGAIWQIGISPFATNLAQVARVIRSYEWTSMNIVLWES